MNLAPDSAGSRSSLLRPAELTAEASLPAPGPHTEAELAALIGLLTAGRTRARTVCLGHSRDEASRTAARAFTEAWCALPGRVVLAVVDWPEHAASWLRPARRLTAQQPDVWVIAAAGTGWAQLARRLRHSTDWAPARTYGFASLAQEHTVALAGHGTLDGVRGAGADGSYWEIGDGSLTSFRSRRR
ncbi:hypothetical protein [Saccharothrix sp. ST-888]|uniref:hypothetical protein n=1 Tax=Saccharothrix sp. ST-888 TaxID=1427391 RepID=UPI0005ED141E|nr:hypothetical protein [Saccharothrix sp. ST-888]KJK58358.1 hypothetical protein UK12_11115 [Saccharothrix sp. ST-888]